MASKLSIKFDKNNVKQANENIINNNNNKQIRLPFASNNPQHHNPTYNSNLNITAFIDE